MSPTRRPTLTRAPAATSSAGDTPARTRLRVIHVLSDSTGNLAQHMLAAFLTQFPQDAFEVHRHKFLTNDGKVQAALDAAVAKPGIVLHAFVKKDIKAKVERFCAAHALPCRDLTGGFVEFIAEASGIEPFQSVQRLHHTSEEYHQRIKALEFTLEHDDGLGLETIHEADIVLTGVSRTSKTPTSVYLAQQGWRVANVSLAIDVNPPQELLALKERVVGLVIDPMRLVEIRTTRSVGWRMGDSRYNDPDYVQREVTWSRRLFASRGWPILDVTARAVEETAARITEVLGLNR